MNGATHVIGGVTVAVMLGQTSPSAFGIVVITSLLPDIDRKNSILGRLIPVLPFFIERVMGKRTVTHSILFGGLFALLLQSFFPNLLIPFVIGFGSHLFLDLLTGRIALFWPLSWKFGIPLFGIPPIFVESISLASWGAWMILDGYHYFWEAIT